MMTNDCRFLPMLTNAVVGLQIFAWADQRLNYHYWDDEEELMIPDEDFILKYALVCLPDILCGSLLWRGIESAWHCHTTP